MWGLRKCRRWAYIFVEHGIISLKAELYSLLHYLDSTPLEADGSIGSINSWRGWQIRRLVGGANNLLYQVTKDQDGLADQNQFAVKFTIRDARKRAEREYYALSALHQAGLKIAPQPVLLDQDRFSQPVVVQTWVEGTVLAEPPQTDADWRRLVQHFATIRALTPDKAFYQTSLKLAKATLNCDSVQAGRDLIRQQMGLIPAAEQPPSLPALVAQFEATPLPEWSEAPLTLCRNDANINNFIRCSTMLFSVDWENSGWGDPAFEIADWMTHPAYATVPSARWEWVMQAYGELTKDPHVVMRIRVYYCILRVWWVIRLARYLYEIPRGLDERLTKLPPNWKADREAKYERYLALAWQVLG